jgi:hypothetical protein
MNLLHPFDAHTDHSRSVLRTGMMSFAGDPALVLVTSYRPRRSEGRIGMSRKQEIYRELLQFGLPYLRSVQSLRWWQTARRQALYAEAEFLHNLSVSILEPEFGSHDIWFLNHQARWFFAHADPWHAPCYEHHRRLIRELFALVPKPLRDKLEWAGPDHPSGQ